MAEVFSYLYVLLFFSFIRYCDQYVPDFVLHGTDRLTDEQAKKSLQISLEVSVRHLVITKHVCTN